MQRRSWGRGMHGHTVVFSSLVDRLTLTRSPPHSDALRREAWGLLAVSSLGFADPRLGGRCHSSGPAVIRHRTPKRLAGRLPALPPTVPPCAPQAQAKAPGKASGGCLASPLMTGVAPIWWTGDG